MRRRSARFFLIACAVLLSSALTARAADTGSVSGFVVDQKGEPIGQATATLTGAALPMPRTAQTGPNGNYEFEYLPPGGYVVEVSASGLGSARRSVVVDVGRTTQVDLVLGITLQEELTVRVATPIVDVRSTEVSFNFKTDTLNSLPLDRTYRGLFQLIPGVADNRSTVGPAAGGTRQDNTYLIDGANITNPGFGYLSTEINELDITEVNLKRAGVTAEFGRTAGTVTNAVSRAGTNRFSGIGRMDWLPDSFVAGYKLPDNLLAAGVKVGTFRDPLLTTEVGPAIGVGGPIVPNRVFFYGSARYSRETKWDRVNKAGVTLPDEVRDGPELFAKLTSAPAEGHQLTASFRYRPNHVDNAGLTSDFAPSVATNTDNGSRIATVEWESFVIPHSAVSVRYLYMGSTNEDLPVKELGYLPPFNPNNLAAMGQYMDPDQANLTVGANQYSNVQNYQRHEVRATLTQLFPIKRTSHTLKIGAGYELGDENLNRLANGWGIIANITQNGVPALRTRYYTPQPAQIGDGQTYAIFTQDEVTIGRRTTVNAGVLLNRDSFSQTLAGSGGCPSTPLLKGGAAVYESSGDTCTFLRFGFTDEVQPRLGISYQLREKKGDKLYANWGRYYNMDQKSSARSLAPNRIFQTQTVFDLNGNVLSSGPLASTTGKLIDPAIKPIYTNEFVAGYATPLSTDLGLDVFFMSRSTHDFIEDLPSRLSGTAPDSGPFVAANLPCTAFAACQAANAERTYRAFTVDVRRQLSRGWTSDVSYTWSRFEGNEDLDYATVATFNTSSFIQDGPGANVEDPFRFGPLLEDRPHLFKAFTSYAVTSRITASGYLRIQSGTPWAARARDWAGGVLNYLEPAGSHRNPAWTNLDLMIAYRLPAKGRVAVSLEGRVLNVFDNQTQLSTDSQQYLDLRTIPNPPYFAPYQQPNPFFGTGNQFAPPRRLYAAAVINF
jgi:hypothetical protein